MNNTRWLVACLSVAVLGGCSIFSKGPPPAFHLLTARAPENIVALDTSIGVGPVRVAPFLTRLNLVTHAGSGDLQLDDTERWGEPLEQGIQRVLLQNIHRLSGAETRNFPWRQSATPHYAVRIDVADLDRLHDDRAVLEVSWQLEDLTTPRVIQSQQAHFSVALNGSDDAALVSAYSELFAQLAEQIARAVPSP